MPFSYEVDQYITSLLQMNTVPASIYVNFLYFSLPSKQWTTTTTTITGITTTAKDNNTYTCTTDMGHSTLVSPSTPLPLPRQRSHVRLMAPRKPPRVCDRQPRRQHPVLEQWMGRCVGSIGWCWVCRRRHRWGSSCWAGTSRRSVLHVVASHGTRASHR